MESILTLFLAFYLASSLTFCLTYFMASILTLFLASIMALYSASILTFYLTFFLANTLTFLQSIWHLFWQASLLADVPRRAPQHPALSIWLGSIGAHSHAEIRRAGRGSRRRLYKNRETLTHRAGGGKRRNIVSDSDAIDLWFPCFFHKGVVLSFSNAARCGFAEPLAFDVAKIWHQDQSEDPVSQRAARHFAQRALLWERHCLASQQVLSGKLTI